MTDTPKTQGGYSLPIVDRFFAADFNNPDIGRGLRCMASFMAPLALGLSGSLNFTAGRLGALPLSVPAAVLTCWSWNVQSGRNAELEAPDRTDSAGRGCWQREGE